MQYPFCFLCLFHKISLSSSSLDWDIMTTFLIVLVFGCFSFLKEIYAKFKGLLFFINLSLIISFLLLSSCGCFVGLFFSYGSTPFSGNHFWNINSRMIVEWHTYFFGSLLVIPSIMFFWHFSHLINSLTNWEYIIVAQLINSP